MDSATAADNFVAAVGPQGIYMALICDADVVYIQVAYEEFRALSKAILEHTVRLN